MFSPIKPSEKKKVQSSADTSRNSISHKQSFISVKTTKGQQSPTSRLISLKNSHVKEHAKKKKAKQLQAMKQEYLMGDNKMSQSVLYTTGDDDMVFNHNSSVVRMIPSPKPPKFDQEPQILNIQMQPEQHSRQPSDFADI